LFGVVAQGFYKFSGELAMQWNKVIASIETLPRLFEHSIGVL